MILFDILVPALFIWSVLSQLVIPLLRGSRLLPLFSKPSHNIADELAEVEQEIATEHLRHTLSVKKAELQKEKDSDAQQQ